MTGQTMMLAFGAAFAAAFGATALVASLARRLGFTAGKEGAQTALGGGVALFAGLAAGLWGAGTSLVLAAAVAPALLLGLADDIVHLRPLPKFLLQIAVAATGVSIFAGAQPLAAFCVAALLGVVLMNGINLVDVSDGYANAICAVSFAGLAWLADMQAAPVMTAACLGFLCWNWPPARIYMGDAGCHLLGMAAALMIVDLRGRVGNGAALVGALCFGAVLFELALLVVLRTRRGIPFWRKSSHHSAFLLQRSGLSTAWAAIAAASAQAGLILAAILLASPT